MIITSLDIALKTLGLAVIQFDDLKSDNFKIIHWDKINILEEISKIKIEPIPKCCGKNDFDYPCKNNGYILNKETKEIFCKKHTKNIQIKKLKDIKKELLKKSKLCVTDLSYNEISRALFKTLDPYIEKYPCIISSDYFLFENQPVLKNKMMKNMQLMYLTYFSRKFYDKDLNSQKGGKTVIKNILIPKLKMEFVNATNKLKLCKEIVVPDKIKNKYEKNKYKSIEKCKQLIKGNLKLEKEFNDFGKKQDDLVINL